MDHCFLAAEHGDGAGQGVPHSKIPDSTGSSEVHRRCNCRQVFLVADPRCCCAVQEVSATPWKSNIQRGMSAHHALLQGQCTWLCNTGECCFSHSCQQRVLWARLQFAKTCEALPTLTTVRLQCWQWTGAVHEGNWLCSVNNEMTQCWQWNDAVLTMKWHSVNN